MKLKHGFALLAASFLLSAPAFGAETIKVGGLWDLTGVTADVGKPFAEGVQDAIDYVNSKGGVNGKKIELVNVDYAYKIPQANATYKKFVEQDKVVMINGWGTGDTEALKDTISKDKIPYFSASFSGHLTDPKGATSVKKLRPTVSGARRFERFASYSRVNSISWHRGHLVHRLSGVSRLAPKLGSALRTRESQLMRGPFAHRAPPCIWTFLSSLGENGFIGTR